MELRERVLLRMNQLTLRPYHLARRMGMKGNGGVWALLSGKTKTFRDMDKLAKALDTTVAWLMTGDEKKITSTRPFSEPDPRYAHILALCMRIWRKPEYQGLTPKVVIDIVFTLYQRATGKRDNELAEQAISLMEHQKRSIAS